MAIRKIYELDQIALEMGHKVMRLPHYHCQYNPIELKKWAQEISNIGKLVNKALNVVTVDNWNTCAVHCEIFQDEHFIKESLRDEILESIIITINQDEDTDTNSKEEDDDVNL